MRKSNGAAIGLQLKTPEQEEEEEEKEEENIQIKYNSHC